MTSHIRKRILWYVLQTGYSLSFRKWISWYSVSARDFTSVCFSDLTRISPHQKGKGHESDATPRWLRRWGPHLSLAMHESENAAAVICPAGRGGVLQGQRLTWIVEQGDGTDLGLLGNFLAVQSGVRGEPAGVSRSENGPDTRPRTSIADMRAAGSLFLPFDFRKPLVDLMGWDASALRPKNVMFLGGGRPGEATATRRLAALV